MDHERFEELKDAYVLGALPEEDRREFEHYLVAYPERQAEIEKLSAVAGLLALSPQEKEPSSKLRSRIMDAVGAEAVRPRHSHRSALAWLGEFLRIRNNLALGAAAGLMIGPFSWSYAPAGGGARPTRPRLKPSKPATGTPVTQMAGLGGTATEQGGRAKLVTLIEEIG